MIEEFWASGEGGSRKETNNIRETGNGENGGKTIGGEMNESKKKRVESFVNFVWQKIAVSRQRRKEGREGREREVVSRGLGTWTVWPCAEPTRHWIDAACLVIYQAPYSLPPPGESIYGNSSDERCYLRLSLPVYDIARGEQRRSLETTI